MFEAPWFLFPLFVHFLLRAVELSQTTLVSIAKTSVLHALGIARMSPRSRFCIACIDPLISLPSPFGKTQASCGIVMIRAGHGGAPTLALYWGHGPRPFRHTRLLIRERLRERRRRLRQIPVRTLVPNLITLLALCAGLTAIRLAIEARLELAVAAIVFAALLDGVDGRVA